MLKERSPYSLEICKRIEIVRNFERKTENNFT